MRRNSLSLSIMVPMSTNLPLNQILVGDCVELLATLPAASINLIFADPPYNLQLRNELRRPNNTRVRGVQEAWDRFDDFAAYDEFTRSWLAACCRVLKPNGTIWVIGSYHNIHRVGAILQDLNYWLLNSVVWIKTNPTPNFRGVRFTNAHETLLWAQKEKGAPYTFNHHAMKALNDGKQMRSDWLLPVSFGAERLRTNGEAAHPTQKPEALLYRVLLASSHPGDVVLDPFFGTGTTGAVAKRLHRNWIGIEREKSYTKLARRRIDEIEPVSYEPELFDPAEPRQQERIPFGHLLEAGLLEPGQRLYFGENGKASARVLADGSLKLNGFRGSIHQVAKELLGAPANGWQHWYYVDPDGGRRRSIDSLRQILREGMKADARTKD
ncbi:MAG: site-specific DNA-methyltransferase [Chloroflexi bacterium]|nr:site-specific DNA-methyltransferase [Chloroflexota bacterium]